MQADAGAGRSPGAPAAGRLAALTGRQRNAATSGVMAAVFLAAVGQTGLATAMPAVVADLGGFERYAWATTAYLIASTVVTPITGRLADIYGRRIFFAAGLAVLIAGSAPIWLVTNMTQLAAWRVVQGVGGGMVMVNGLAAIADLFAPEDRAKAQGLLGAVIFLAAVVGPLVAGYLADNVSWRWIFLLNVPAGLLVLAFIVRTFPAVRPAAADRRLDYAGMLALALAVTPVMIALSWSGEQQAWNSPPARGLFAFGLLMAAAFVLIESKAAAPVMPLHIYGNRVVSASVVLTVLASFCLYGVVLFTPLFFQSVQGVSATGSGGMLAALGGGVVLGAVGSGQALSRLGGNYRLAGVLGGCLMSGGTWLLASMSAATSLGSAAAYLVVVGAGIGCLSTITTVAVQNTVPFALVGAATSALQFFRLVSSATGLALLGAVLAMQFAARLAAGLGAETRALLAPGQLEALQSNPRVLDDPAAADALRASLAEAGPAGAAGGRRTDQRHERRDRRGRGRRVRAGRRDHRHIRHRGPLPRRRPRKFRRRVVSRRAASASSRPAGRIIRLLLDP